MANELIISFDVGGTLLKTDKPGFCTQLCQITGLKTEEIRPLLDRYFLTRNVTLEEAIEAFCLNTRLATPSDILEHYQRTTATMFDDVQPVLMSLQELGYIIITLSNCTRWEAGGLDELGLSRLISYSFHSFEIGFAKPDPRAFDSVRTALGVAPELFLHIGDSVLADVVGARRAGWDSIAIKRRTISGREALDSDVPTIESLWELLPLLSLRHDEIR